MSITQVLEVDRERLAAPTDLVSVAPHFRADLPNKDHHGTAEDHVFGAERVRLERAQELAAQHPTSLSMIVRLAHAQALTGQIAEAKATAMTAIALTRDTHDVPGIVALSRVLVGLNQGDHARALLEPLSDEPVVASQLANLAAARGEFDFALDLLKEADPASEALRGWILIQQGHFSSAIHHLRNATREAQSRLPDAFVNLGYAFAAVGAYKKALKATEEAIYIAPYSRLALFNAVGYLILLGRQDEATMRLTGMADRFPRDPHIMLARADVLAQSGDRRGAIRLLQEFRAKPRFNSLSKNSRAEIIANTHFLRWHAGDLSGIAAAEMLREQLLAVEFKNLDVARLLLVILLTTDERKQADTLVGNLETAHRPEKLFEFRARLAFAELEFERALTLSRRWFEVDPFSAEAATLYSCLLCEYQANLDECIRIADTAARRIPGVQMLTNNLAFALAIKGNVARAQAVLKVDETQPHTLATRAAIDLSAGRLELGVERYEQAARRAADLGNALLARLIRARFTLMLAQLGRPHDDFIELQTEDLHEPTGALLGHIAARYGVNIKTHLRT